MSPPPCSPQKTSSRLRRFITSRRCNQPATTTPTTEASNEKIPCISSSNNATNNDDDTSAVTVSSTTTSFSSFETRNADKPIVGILMSSDRGKAKTTRNSPDNRTTPRNIRFAENLNQFHDNTIMSHEECVELWFSRDDLKAFDDSTRFLAVGLARAEESCAHNATSYTNILLDIYQACCNTKLEPMGEEASILSPQERHDFILRLKLSSSRLGLEKKIVRQIGQDRNNRRRKMLKRINKIQSRVTSSSFPNKGGARDIHLIPSDLIPGLSGIPDLQGIPDLHGIPDGIPHRPPPLPRHATSFQSVAGTDIHVIPSDLMPGGGLSGIPDCIPDFPQRPPPGHAPEGQLSGYSSQMMISLSGNTRNVHRANQQHDMTDENAEFIRHCCVTLSRPSRLFAREFALAHAADAMDGQQQGGAFIKSKTSNSNSNSNSASGSGSSSSSNNNNNKRSASSNSAKQGVSNKPEQSVGNTHPKPVMGTSVSCRGLYSQ